MCNTPISTKLKPLILTFSLLLAIIVPVMLLAQGPVVVPRGPPTVPEGPPTVVVEPSRYLSNLYLWFLGFVGIAALLAFVIGGVTYMFAGANETLVGQAKKWIWNGIWGIVLAAFSYLLLNTINPDLVRGFDIQTVIDSAIRSR